MDPNNYNFITQQGTASSTGGSQKQRIIVAIIGLVILLLVGIIFYSLVFGSQKTNAQILLPVGAAQADILELTKEGSKDARTSKLLNTNSTTALVISTHSSQTLGLIGKDASKQIAPFQNKEFTKALDDARQAGNFDSTYESILSTRLDLYQQTLMTAFSEITDPSVKKTIEQQYSQVSTLRGKPTTPQE
jgi:uncharacterized membrane-anchored protein YhcB (DUF1043 family)